jgi:hypothetical protein
MKKIVIVLFFASFLVTNIFGQENALEINETGVVQVNQTLSHFNGNSYDPLPKGTILMFSGENWVDNQTIPGWYACIAPEGQPTKTIQGVGTIPNLVDRFVMGSQPEEIEQTGGANSVQLTEENLPSHSHSYTYRDGTGRNYYSGGSAAFDSRYLTTREGQTSIVGEDLPFDNRPAYYTVIYIIKMQNPQE